MILVLIPLTVAEIKKIQNDYGSYVKITADIDDDIAVVGCELHADGEDMLLKKGSRQSNIWGGGLDFKSRMIDTTAVLNLRPNLENDSMEILDTSRRERFIAVVKRLFKMLWES